MTSDGLQNWKGEPINTEKHGGVRATIFIFAMVVTTSTAYVSNMLNIVTYCQNFLYTSVADTTNIVTNFLGMTSAFALLGAFLSDSYITRIKTILIFAPLEVLGFGLLALQAHVPSLRPPPCDTTSMRSNCKPVNGYMALIFYLGLYSVALGEGCVRACLAPLGGDQFQDDDTIERRQKSSFFNWFTFGISLGLFIGVIVIVWVENTKGWDYGFGLSALVDVIGILIIASGLPFYRTLKPSGSPLTRVLQVFVVAYKNRNLALPESEDLLREGHKEEQTEEMEVLRHTKDFRFLDKATLLNGRIGDWSLCSSSQVEETKIALRVLPIVLSSVLCYIPFPLITSLTIQQGNTMDTSIGAVQISPTYLMVIPTIFQLVILVTYDRFFVPYMRKITRRESGISQLKRVGIGFLSLILATCVAAGMERKRKAIAESNMVTISGDKVSMSVFWLSFQFFLLGILDATSFVGLLEFLNGEMATGMKSLATAIFWCLSGLSALMATFVVSVVNRATRNGNTNKGWLEGNDLNESHLDRFYWFLSVFGSLCFLNYIFWARKYIYRQRPHAIAM